MPRHRALIPLSHDHHHTLVLALRLKKGSPTTTKDIWPQALEEQLQRTIEYANSEILPHFLLEEQFLFPAADRIPEAHPIVLKLRAEHDALRQMLAALSIVSGQNEILAVFLALGSLLESHIRKEERELFPILESKLSDEAFILLSQQLKPAS